MEGVNIYKTLPQEGVVMGNEGMAFQKSLKL
jgi:hypothetical protein